MLDRVLTGVEQRIDAIVGDVLSKRGVNGPVASCADLGRLGMTSVDMVELMLAVEAEFDLTIPTEEITMTSFGTPAGIAGLVTRLRRAS